MSLATPCCRRHLVSSSECRKCCCCFVVYLCLALGRVVIPDQGFVLVLVMARLDLLRFRSCFCWVLCWLPAWLAGWSPLPCSFVIGHGSSPRSRRRRKEFSAFIACVGCGRSQQSCYIFLGMKADEEGPCTLPPPLPLPLPRQLSSFVAHRLRSSSFSFLFFGYQFQGCLEISFPLTRLD